jgi:hypothetical protein
MKALSMSQQAEPYVEAMLEGCDYKARVTRMRFEDMCYDLYDRAKVCVLIITTTASRITGRNAVRTAVSTASASGSTSVLTSTVVTVSTATGIVLLLQLVVVVVILMQ